MTIRWFNLVGVVAVLSCAAWCRAEEWRGDAAVSFAGSSTLHDFGGSVTAANVRVVTEGAGAALSWSASGAFAVSNLTTFHKSRDAKMWAMFGAASWPEVRAATTGGPIPAGATGCTVRVEIKGITNDLPARVSEWTFGAESLSFEVGFPVSLKSFALKPPSVLGIIGVGDVVEVKGRVEAKPVR